MRVRPTRYKVGQWVYHYSPRRFVRRSPKWQRIYNGPFLIVQRVGPVNVKLQATRRSAPFITHIDKLKLCLGPTPESWLETGEQVEGGESLEQLQPLTALDLGDEVAQQVAEDEAEALQAERPCVVPVGAGEPSRPVRMRQRPGYLRDFV